MHRIKVRAVQLTRLAQKWVSWENQAQVEMEAVEALEGVKKCPRNIHRPRSLQASLAGAFKNYVPFLQSLNIFEVSTGHQAPVKPH